MFPSHLEHLPQNITINYGNNSIGANISSMKRHDAKHQLINWQLEQIYYSN